MLADLAREQEAAKVLEPSVAIGEKDPVTLASAYEAIFRTPPSPEELQAKIDHWLGIHYGREGNIAKQKELLEKALTVSVEDIDIVIALYRVADDGKAWRDKVDTLLAKHVQRVESQMKELEQIIATSQDRDVRGLMNEQFAQKNNEYAWLVSNTVGDYQKAVACSKSIDLQSTVGIGSGMFNSPNTAAMMGTVPAKRRGIAAGARMMVQNTGAVISIAFVLAIVTASVPKDVLLKIFSGVTTGLSDAQLDPFIANMHTALWVLAATSVLGAIVSLMRPRHEVATPLAAAPREAMS